MSPTDKIVSFKAPAPQAPLLEQSPDTQVEHLTETEAAAIDLAMFLLDNKSRIQNFVCGIACEPPPEDADENDTEFHLVTSPIDARDYAMALKMFEDGFRRNLGQTRVVEE